MHDQPFVQAAQSVDMYMITLVGRGLEWTCGQFPGREGAHMDLTIHGTIHLCRL